MSSTSRFGGAIKEGTPSVRKTMLRGSETKKAEKETVSMDFNQMMNEAAASRASEFKVTEKRATEDKIQHEEEDKGINFYNFNIVEENVIEKASMELINEDETEQCEGGG